VIVPETFLGLIEVKCSKENIKQLKNTLNLSIIKNKQV
jgi:hypothetical protein